MRKYKFSLRRALDKIQVGVRDVTCFGVELLNDNNPMMRMFFDSDIGSNIEQAVQIAISSSVSQSILEKVPKFKWTTKIATKIGSFVARKEIWALDRAKLTYQLARKRISLTEYNEELNKRQASTLVAAVDMAKHGLTTTIATLSLEIGLDPLIVKGVLESATANIHLNREKAKRILVKGKEQFSKAVVAIDKALETMHDRAVEAYQKTKAFVERVSNKVEPGWDEIKTKAQSCVNKIEERTKLLVGSVKEKTKAVFGSLKGMIKRKK